MARKLAPVHPGEILLEEFLEPAGLSQYRLARDISVPPRRINEIVLGKRGVSADTALRLGRYFGTTPQFWLNLQSHFDLEKAGDQLHGAIGKKARGSGVRQARETEGDPAVSEVREKHSEQSTPSADVERVLRGCLVREGYRLSGTRANGETGVDILASQGEEVVHIEVIGFKRSPPARSKDFFECFFRSISRITDGATRVVMALPARFERGLSQRAAQYGEVWDRLGSAFPELEIWLVEVQDRRYERRRWSDWPTHGR
jgi:addiction module HigA family antidote